MFLSRLVAFALCVAPCAALAQGTPRSIGECERLKNDLAYNQCLAIFGPAAKNVAAGYASVDAAAAPALPEAAPAEAEVDAAPRQRRYRGRHRRQYAMFSTGESGSYRRHRRR